MMIHTRVTYATLLAALLLCSLPVGVQADDDQAGVADALKQSRLFDMIDVLDGIDQQTQSGFFDLLAIAIERKVDAGQNNVFERADPAMRELATELYKDILTIPRPEIERLPWEVREQLGWTTLFVCIAMPSDIASEGLVRAIDEMDNLHRFNDKYNDLIKIVYGLDGSGRPADFDPVVSRLSGKNKLEGELRDKLIAHLIGFAPEQTFRLVLEKEKKALDDIAALSWFDRRWHEQHWAEKNNIKLDPAFNKQLLKNYKDLLKHNVWWVRLYAVELLARSPHLLEKDALKAMSNDPHRLVRSRVLGLLDQED